MGLNNRSSQNSGTAKMNRDVNNDIFHPFGGLYLSGCGVGSVCGDKCAAVPMKYLSSINLARREYC